MTRYFYSPGTKGFYIGGLHGKIPKDVVEITETEYVDLLQANHAGKDIIFEDGGLTVQDTNFDYSWERIKAIRNKLLKDSDWVFSDDSPVTEEEKAQWRVYRKELRNITNAFDKPSEVVWPTPPNSN